MSPRDLSPSLDHLFERTEAALEQLYALPLHESPNDIHRDAAIHRFRVAFEILWRTGQRFLDVEEGLEMGSPKGVIRAARSVGVLPGDDGQLALTMADDRNLTGHAYDAENAREIYGRLSDHGDLMKRWFEAMKARVGE